MAVPIMFVAFCVNLKMFLQNELRYVHAVAADMALVWVVPFWRFSFWLNLHNRRDCQFGFSDVSD